jgi:chemotaxis protein methyltransferase CheR
MRDEQCVRFLQWALPKMHMRWRGYRKVRRQVCKRVDRRIQELGLAGVEAYRSWLGENDDEWRHLDACCRITISRFYRDRAVFDALADHVLPVLADAARRRGDTVLRTWSAGCGCGEEPYTLAIIWHNELRHRFPGMGVEIVATDADPNVLRRARAGRYESGSLKELPERLREQAFDRDDDAYRIKPESRRGVRFLEQDIREGQPGGCFDLVLCRNLVFTYFDECRQRELLRRIAGTMHDGAALVLGAHEHLPDDVSGLHAWFDKHAIYRSESGGRHPAS